MKPAQQTCRCGYDREVVTNQRPMCKKPGCDYTPVVQGFCDQHYLQWQKDNDRENWREQRLREAWAKTGIVLDGHTPAQVANLCKKYLRERGYLKNLPPALRGCASQIRPEADEVGVDQGEPTRLGPDDF